MDNAVKKKLLKAAGKEHVREDKVQRTLYAFDATGQRHLPELVIRATDAEQISRIMQVCHEHRIPVTPEAPALPCPAVRCRCPAASCWTWPA